MARGLIDPIEAYVGFVQIDGVTIPVVTDGVQDWMGYVKCLAMDDDGELYIMSKSFYELSEYEFHKWFDWTVLDNYLDYNYVPGNIYFAPITMPPPIIFRR